VFKRRRSAEPSSDDATEDGPPDEADAGPTGPYDVDDIGEDGVERVDLGSLLIAPAPDRELRLQVDETSQAVQSVLVAGPDGALELRAFAAPRHGDLWSEARRQIAAETAQRGGTTSEREGRFGTELICQLSVQLPNGKSAVQPSRVVGINGSRWLLRGTFVGAPAESPDDASAWDDILAAVVVNRGSHAMPVGDPLPLTLPPGARRSG
jgi:hypothetical protein